MLGTNLSHKCLGGGFKLQSCAISRKTNDANLGQLSDDRETNEQMDQWTDGWTDGKMDSCTDQQKDKSDFIGHCPTNVERPKKSSVSF